MCQDKFIIYRQLRILMSLKQTICETFMKQGRFEIISERYHTFNKGIQNNILIFKILTTFYHHGLYVSKGHFG